MRRFVVLGFNAVALVVPVAAAHGQDVTFRVTGAFDTYSEVSDIPFGAPFVVEYTYDASTPPDPFRSEWFQDPGAVRRADVGGLYLEAPPTVMTVILNNDEAPNWCPTFDNYDVYNSGGSLTDGAVSHAISEIEFQVHSCSVPGVIAGQGASLPVEAPDLDPAETRFLRVCVENPSECDPEDYPFCESRPLCAQGTIESWTVCGDEDADGVDDCLDQCPGTAAGSATDADGCDAAQLVCGCAQGASGGGDLLSNVAQCTTALWGGLPPHAYANVGALISSFATGALTCPTTP